jgi:site-specific recombinase XerD
LKIVENQLGDLISLDRQLLKKFIIDRLNSGQSPATVNHYIRSLKVYYSFVLREEYLEKNPIDGLSLAAIPETIKPVLELKQISMLHSSIQGDNFFAARDKAMILLLWDTAIRLKELLSIKTADLDLISKTIRINGKGRNEGIVPFGLKTKREMVNYLKLRREIPSDYLFCACSGYPVMARNFQRSLNSHGKKLNLKITPHLIRHSAATYLAKNEMPAQHIQILLGHSNLSTTQRYINQIVNQEGLQISHRRLSPGDRL